MMFVKMLSRFGKGENTTTTEISSVIIPTEFEFLGEMTAWNCPNCANNRIYMFGSLDNDSLIVRCDDCRLEISHSDRVVINRLWEGPKETTCPNCNTLFNLLIEKGLA